MYLVRHAIAEPRDAGRWPNDADRPLTRDGARRFRRAARGLRRMAPRVDRVLSSPYVRAWDTAEILERDAGWPTAERADGLAPDHDPEDGVRLVGELDPGETVALVGHEPYLSSLAALLLGSEIRLELKKGGVVLLELPDAQAGATLRWSASPKMLRAIEPR